MANYMDYPENDPRHHTMKIQQRFQDLITHLREDVDKVNDPQAKALFETSAEVLDGLTRAFHHYENRSEKAWQNQ
jgi:hypothetical protein